MKNTYFTSKDYDDNWSYEVSEAMKLYERISENFPDYGLLYIDFTYKSDTKKKLDDLSKSLKLKFGINSIEIKKKWWHFELNANTENFPLTKDNLTYWLISFNKKGYLFDCKLVGYGALTDIKNVKLLDYSTEKEDYYYEKGQSQYEKGNLWGAIINWTNCIKVNPNSYQSYKAIGYTKNELHLPFDAIKSYEKAIQINPNYRAALVNLGALKDRFEEYEEAIKYYDKAIKVAPKNPQAYFNKGNTMFNLKRNEEACKLWYKSKELGANYAQERIDLECKK